MLSTINKMEDEFYASLHRKLAFMFIFCTYTFIITDTDVMLQADLITDVLDRVMNYFLYIS